MATTCRKAWTEIYYILRGSGDMVAGVDAGGSDLRHPAKQGQPHDLILTVRSSLPGSPGRRGGRER